MSNGVDDWDYVKLESLGEIYGGSTPSRSTPGFWGGSIPWVTPSEVTSLRTKWLEDTNECITQAGLNGCGTRLLPEESLLVTTRATLGYVALAKHRVCTNQGFKSLVPNERCNPHFYYHMLRFHAKELERLAKGSTFRELSNKDFRTLELPCPDCDEQRRIAEILDTADEAIQKTETLIVKLKQMKVGLLHALLTRGIDQNGQLRRYDENELVPSEIGLIPRTWKAKPLSEIVSPNRPICYGILMPGYGHPGGIPVIKVKDITNGRVNTNELLLTSPQIDEAYSRSRTMPGDLLLTIRGTVGRLAIVPETLPRANITQDTARIGIVNANPVYVRYYLGTHAPRAFIANHILGVAVKGINLRDVRRIPIVLPPRDEQDRIALILESHAARIESEMRTLTKLQKLKSGLMHDLLTGKKRVNQTAPASV